MTVAVEKERKKLLEREKKYLAAKQKSTTGIPFQRLEQYVPEKLQQTLELAFEKGFSLCFQRGNAVIEKTFSKEKHSQDYQIRAYADQVKGNRKTLKAFSKKSQAVTSGNMLLATFEGMGLGVLGIGMPDIPLFIGVLLKSIYEIALSYGYDYEQPKEQIFLLKLITAALTHGEDFFRYDQELETFLTEEGFHQIPQCLNLEIHLAAKALSDELLYAKFLQTIPVAGALGGAFNSICLRKVTQYADLKYHKRFLLNQAEA